jgi:hypothetical protein
MQNENKHLVLRVFPAGNHDLGNVLEAIRPLPESVSVSIKLTPERFWPSFPNNPALLAVREREVWAEIDLVGEEVGWGIFPFPRIDELQGGCFGVAVTRLSAAQYAKPAGKGSITTGLSAPSASATWWPVARC